MTDKEDDEFPQYKLPPSICWQCQTVMEMASALGRYAVEPGAVSICIVCAAIAMYDENLRLRPATAQELAEIKANDAWAKIAKVREMILARPVREDANA